MLSSDFLMKSLKNCALSIFWLYFSRFLADIKILTISDMRALGLLFLGGALGLEQGKYSVTVHQNQLARIPKNLYNASDISLQIQADCQGKDNENGKVTLI